MCLVYLHNPYDGLVTCCKRDSWESERTDLHWVYIMYKEGILVLKLEVLGLYMMSEQSISAQSNTFSDL